MSEKITFKELVEKISKKTRQSEQTTDSFIHELAAIIESGLTAGEKITIAGFGKFELRWMDERKGRNPQTGEEITIEAQNKVVFKPYKALREHVNQPFSHLESKIIKDKPEKLAAPVMSAFASVHEASEEPPRKPDEPETIDDLISEKPSPVEGKIPPVFDEDEDDSAKHEEDITDIFAERDQEIIDQPIVVSSDRTKLAEDVQEKGTFHWSYTAASIIVLLAIFILLYIMFRPDPVIEDTTPTLADQQPIEQMEQITPPEPTVAEQEPSPPVESTITHSIAGGESLWTIAENFYGDPYLWPMIYAENSTILQNPNQIISGANLELPVLSDPDNLTQEDSENIARGYLAVYDWMVQTQQENAREFLWAAGSFSMDILQQASDRVDEADYSFAIQR